MKKLNQVQAACLQAAALLACSAALSTAQAQSGSQAASTAEVPEIIVTASRSEQLLQTAPVGATIITRAQIESAGVVDANEAIRKIGGVAARSDLNGGREYVLDLRGFGATASENTVVLIDGIRISENEQTTARLSALAASSIERIEILRGGSSVMWGEGATAGVINIILRKDVKVGISGGASAGIESYGGHDGTVTMRVGSSSGKNVFDINARSAASNGYRDNSRFAQDTFAMGLNSNDEGLRFRTRLSHETYQSRWPGASSWVDFQTNPRLTVKPKEWGSHKETRLTSGIDMSFGVWTAIVDLGIKNKSTLSYSPRTSATDSTQFSPRLVFKDNVGSAALTANVGLDVNNWNYRSDSFFGARIGKQTNRAIFAMTDLFFPTNTRLVVGYRTEGIIKNAQDIGGAAIPSMDSKLKATELALNQTLTKGWDLYGRMAKSYRLPNIDEFTYVDPAAGKLRPQTTNDKEIGVKWRTGASNVTFRTFTQNSKDEIFFDTWADSGNGGNINLDPTKRSGFELQGMTNVSPSVSIGGSFQSVSAKFDGGVNAGKYIPLVSKRTASLRGNYRLDAKQSIDTAWRIQSAAYWSGDELNANTCGLGKIPSSRILDAQYRWVDKNIEISVGAANLLNVRTYSYASCNAWATGLYPEAGRTLRATLKYNF
jgi:iron complex outermembrane recepter protein